MLNGKKGMSDYGTKQTSISTLNMSAFGGKADIYDRRRHFKSSASCDYGRTAEEWM